MLNISMPPHIQRAASCALYAALLTGLRAPVDDRGDDQEALAFRHEPPKELFEIVKVVDGDTIHIMRDGEVEKLRLLCVDTEERISDGYQGSETKPQTVFGEECALWAQDFFAKLGDEGKPPRVGLHFPNGEENRGNYGRLLCHVVLPDGTDFNLLLVEQGKSPYFTKYGPSRVCHEPFLAAQKLARAAKLGIWNPETNEPKKPGAWAAKRPYERLLPWWDARSAAIQSFRESRAQSPLATVGCDDAEGLQKCFAAKKPEVEIFGQIYKIYDETDGSQTVAFRRATKESEVKVRIPREHVESHAKLDLAASLEDFRQNYLVFKGKLERGSKCYEMVSTDAAQWRRAGPEPAVVREGALSR